MTMLGIGILCSSASNNCRLKGVVSVFFLYVIVFFTSAEAKSADISYYGELAVSQTYYASSSHAKSDWGDLTNDYERRTNVSYIKKIPSIQKLEYIESEKKQKVALNKNNLGWFAKDQRTENQNKWKNARGSEGLMSGAVAPMANNVNSDDSSSKSSNSFGTDQNELKIEKDDSIIEISDNIRIKKRREIMSLTLNNNKSVNVDQKVYLNKTVIYGAYAEVYSEDDFSFGLGPEYSHSSLKVRERGETKSDSDLGLGFRMMIGF